MNIVELGKSKNILCEINKNGVIQQNFIPECSFLHKIEICFGVMSNRLRTGKTYIEIFEENSNTKLFSKVLTNLKIQNYAVNLIDVDINLFKHKKYFLKIWSNTNLGNGIFALYEPKPSFNELSAMNKTVPGELCVKMIYKGEAKNNAFFDSNKSLTTGLISVIIPCYNSASIIKQTLDSIMNQTYNNFEIILVDDCSDDSKELNKIIENYPIKKSIRNKTNLKQTKTKNIGVKEAIGEFLFFCDSDVNLLPIAFEKFIQKLHENSDAGWCYSNFVWGNYRMKYFEFNLKELYNTNFSSNMSLIRHKLFPGFDEDLIKLEDWELFIRMAEQGNFGVWENTFLFSSPWTLTGVTNNSIPEKLARELINKKHSKVLVI
jgi:hypothetical protein